MIKKIVFVSIYMQSKNLVNHICKT